jgi:hypothetical protein
MISASTRMLSQSADEMADSLTPTAKRDTGKETVMPSNVKTEKNPIIICHLDTPADSLGSFVKEGLSATVNLTRKKEETLWYCPS